MIKLRFITENNIGSRIIRYYSWSEFSHVDFVWPTDAYLGARLDGGVRLRPYNYTKPAKQAFFGIELGKTKEREILGIAFAQIGKPYNWKGITGFALNEDWQSGKSWFCSQLVAHCFAAAGEPLLRVSHSDRVTPSDLTMSLRLTELHD